MPRRNDDTPPAQELDASYSRELNLQQRLVRLAIAFVCLLACLYLIQAAGRRGLSNLLAGFVIKASMLPGTEPEPLLASADEASQYAPSNPEGYRARGVARLALNQPSEAATEFAHAASLRPRHHLLWIELGHARDQAEDLEGSIEAFRRAVQLAPYFAQPRWYLGNVLFRAGRYDEAFGELRRAVAGDATLLPLALELAWAASGGDVRVVENYIQPQTSSARLNLARFLAKQGKANEAVELFRATGSMSEQDRRALLSELMATKKYTAAYEVWASQRGAQEQRSGLAAITDGGFEQKVNRHEPGFGWRLNFEVQTVRIELETSETKEGERSLRLDWNGNSNPNSQLVTQLVLVEPNKDYKLRFSALVKNVVSGGLPVIVVSDASSKEYLALGQSSPLKVSERQWEDFELEFKTGEQTEAVQISLQRQPCATDPCPIFGRLWLDGFQMQKK